LQVQYITLYTLKSPKINASWVTQESILSSIIFNIFATDQLTILYYTTMADYVDNKVLMSISENPLITSYNLKLYLNIMSKWYEKWRWHIKIIRSKSIHTTFTFKQGVYPLSNHLIKQHPDSHIRYSEIRQ